MLREVTQVSSSTLLLLTSASEENRCSVFGLWRTSSAVFLFLGEVTELTYGRSTPTDNVLDS